MVLFLRKKSRLKDFHTHIFVLAANIFHYKTDKSEQSDLPCQNIVVAITGAEEMTESLISGHTPFYCFGSTAAGAAVSRAGFKCVENELYKAIAEVEECSTA